MALAKIVAVNIYDEKLYNTGHLVDRWAASVRRASRDGIRNEAPVNKRKNKSGSAKTDQPTGPPGFLKANIISSKQRSGLRQFDINVASKAGYSLRVIHGTSGGNRGSRGKPYRIPLNSGYGGRVKHWKFRGQAPNDFMNAGLDRAALRHPSLAG